MTLRMWFVWLLRGDLRGQHAVGSEEGLREFVVWWLLWGHQLYGLDSTTGPEQLAVAMEPVPAGGGSIPRLLRRLHRESTDLRRLFDLDTAAGRAEYVAWFSARGLGELERAAPEPEHGRAAVQPRAGTGMPGRSLSLLEIGGELQARLPAGASSLVRRGGSAPNENATPPVRSPEDDPNQPLVTKRRTPCRGRAAPFGVNLVGFASGELGLGEDVRMLSLALTGAEVPHVVINLPNLAQTRAQDQSVANRVVDRLRYPITVFSLNPFDTADFYARGREELFRADHNIGYWAWELPEMPPFWQDAYRLVDEVWAASRYTAAAFQRTSSVPVQILPPCVEIPEIGRLRAAARKLREVRGSRFRFIFPFDRNSFVARKNPWAALAAFRQAFAPEDHSVELLLRINGERGNDEEVARLRKEAEADGRIDLREGTLPRAEALALLASSDCLISPHRAEGFGRNIAEAILLEVPVLATRFGGSVDFLNSAEGIDWRPVRVREDEYPHAIGQWWAEPDITHLARRMTEVREVRASHRRS